MIYPEQKGASLTGLRIWRIVQSWIGLVFGSGAFVMMACPQWGSKDPFCPAHTLGETWVFLFVVGAIAMGAGALMAHAWADDKRAIKEQADERQARERELLAVVGDVEALTWLEREVTLQFPDPEAAAAAAIALGGAGYYGMRVSHRVVKVYVVDPAVWPSPGGCEP